MYLEIPRYIFWLLSEIWGHLCFFAYKSTVDIFQVFRDFKATNSQWHATLKSSQAKKSFFPTRIDTILHVTTNLKANKYVLESTCRRLSNLYLLMQVEWHIGKARLASDLHHDWHVSSRRGHNAKDTRISLCISKPLWESLRDKILLE